MLPSKLAFVDIETTGAMSLYDRIIEIGIIRVEDNKIVRTFNSLLNPLTHLPPEIERLTGIKSQDLEGAPPFTSVRDEVEEILSDCVFVAHNVRFDYGFLKSEFRREEKSFTSKHFCTVRLSQMLFPEHRRHNLDAIIERFGFTIENRHRAFDDAKILFDFYSHLQKTIDPETLSSAVDKALKKPSLPKNLTASDVDSLPESPGVYIFYGEKRSPLYIGKSINIKDRVLSHFSSDLYSGSEMKITQQIHSIETMPTAGELGALFLESSLIKSMLPLYNKRLRLKKQLVVLKNKKDPDGYERVRIETVQDILPEDIKALQSSDDEEGIIGFFKSQKQAKEYLLKIAKEYGLCERLLGIEKTSSECFGYRLGRCKGACLGEEDSLFYNLRFQGALSTLVIKPWPFPGPVMIEEKHPYEDKVEYFLVDRWCYLGKKENDDDGKELDVEKETLFDLDTYKILRQFLLKPSNQKKIKIIKKNTPLLDDVGVGM